MRTAERLRGRGGYTLVELVVALLIGTIVIAVLFQLMSGQTRLTAVQSGREEAQQNARGALEVISSELRGAMATALVEGGEQTLTFFQPRSWGILCTGVVGATTFNAVFPDVGAPGAWAAGSASGVLLRGTAAGAPFTPAPAAFPNRARIVDSSVLGAPTAGNCPLGPQGAVVVVRFTVSQPVSGSAGDLVATYTATRYDLGASQGRNWLRRSNGIGDNNAFSMQPLAGPVEPDRFRIRYLGANGNDLGTPGTNAAVLANVRQVQVQVVTESTQRLDGNVQRDSGTTTVTLRN